MKGVRCEKCQTVLFPPREVCPHCAAIEAANNGHSNVITVPELREMVLQRTGR